MNKRRRELLSEEYEAEVNAFSAKLRPLAFWQRNMLEVSIWLLFGLVYLLTKNWTAVILDAVILVLLYRNHMSTMLLETIDRMVEETRSEMVKALTKKKDAV